MALAAFCAGVLKMLLAVFIIIIIIIIKYSFISATVDKTKLCHRVKIMHYVVDYFFTFYFYLCTSNP